MVTGLSLAARQPGLTRFSGNSAIFPALSAEGLGSAIVAIMFLWTNQIRKRNKSRVRYQDYKACHKNDEFIRVPDAVIDQCAMFGIAMRVESLRRGDRERCPTIAVDQSELKARKIQALGAVCEGAGFLAMGWEIELKAQVYKVADLPGNIQVRLIGVDNYGLRIKPRDNPEWKVFGVVIPLGMERQPYRLPGWIYAADAMREEWKMAPRGGPPMWAVPQEFLRPNQELRDILTLEGLKVSSKNITIGV
jgi:hypothetical protein